MTNIRDSWAIGRFALLLLVALGTAAGASAQSRDNGNGLIDDGERSLSVDFVAPKYAELRERGIWRSSDLTIGDDTFSIDWTPFDAIAPGARIVRVDAGGEQILATPRVLTYMGRIIGREDATAFLAVTPDGVSGYVQSGTKTYVVSSGPYGDQLAAKMSDLATLHPGRSQPVCATTQEHVIWHNDGDGGGGGMREAPPCRTALVAVETDYEFTGAKFGGNTDASAAYATALIAATSAIYTRDFNVRLEISYLRVWATDSDPWDQPDTGSQLGQFRDYWAANMGSVNRHIATFLSGRGLGGGVAWVGVICNYDYGYSVSAVDGYFPYPLRDHDWGTWDVFVTAHELGHNFNAWHTHDLSPPADGCGLGDCSDRWGGTIMSYCHICDGGMSNIVLRIHERNISENILPHLESTCALTSAPFDGFALDFDGTGNQYVDGGSSSDFDLKAPFTLEGWVRADVTSGVHRFVTKGSSGSNGWGLGIKDGKLHFSTYGITSYTTTSALVAAGEWAHIAVVFDTSFDASFYANGEFVQKVNGTSNPRTTSKNLYFGRNASGSVEAWDGRADEVRVWSIARTASEIAEHYYEPLDGTETGLVAYWRFNEGSGSTTADETGEPAHDGTIVGAQWATVRHCDGDLGACCFTDSTCIDVTRADCPMFGGLFLGEGTSCGVTKCPIPGRCCVDGENGACRIVREPECDAMGGTFGGENTLCDGFGPFDGYSLAFDGVDDAVEVAHSNPLSFKKGGSVTIEAWVYPRVIDDFHNIVCKDAESENNYALRLNSNGTVEFFARQTNNGGWFGFVTNQTVRVGDWTHIALTHTYGQNSYALYLNGELVSGTSYGDPSLGALRRTGALDFGAIRPSPGKPFYRGFDGQIDEVRIWGLARTQDEIRQSIRTALKGDEQGLVGYWRFDDGSGTTAIDTAGGDNPGKLYSAAWTATKACGASVVRGDLNCDGLIDFNDIDAFVAALISRSEYEAQYPGCDWLSGDVNEDGVVDFDDIDGFVDCLVNGGC